LRVLDSFFRTARAGAMPTRSVRVGKACPRLRPAIARHGSARCRCLGRRFCPPYTLPLSAGQSHGIAVRRSCGRRSCRSTRHAQAALHPRGGFRNQIQSGGLEFARSRALPPAPRTRVARERNLPRARRSIEISGGALHRHQVACRLWPKPSSLPPRLSATVRRIGSKIEMGSLPRFGKRLCMASFRLG
jgi:hypothetical protein